LEEKRVIKREREREIDLAEDRLCVRERHLIEERK
jgi:hypothetical protein